MFNLLPFKREGCSAVQPVKRLAATHAACALSFAQVSFAVSQASAMAGATDLVKHQLEFAFGNDFANVSD